MRSMSPCSRSSQALTDEAVRSADYVITMGCGDACPIYPRPPIPGLASG
jgi:protein-tyrosine-phosphatase